MGNWDPDTRDERPEQVIPVAVELLIRQIVNSAMPGNVVSYSARTKRAIIQPSIRTMFTETPGTPRRPAEAKPPIVDVPVCHPSAGGYIVHLPLRSGDPVMLIFSQRGLDAFKQSFGISDPSRGCYFSMRDAVAFPGFGGLEFTPASSTGLSLQTEDGNTSLVLTPGRVVINAADIRMVGSSLTHNGANVGDTHTHGGISRGASDTDEPS